mgnify:FL=1
MSREFNHLLRIDSNLYRLVKIVPDPGSGVSQAWRLTKLIDGGKPGKDDVNYIVHLDRNHGLACTCPDYCCRREGTTELCKHLWAAVESGLITANDGGRCGNS